MATYIVRGLVITTDGRIANTSTSTFHGHLNLVGDVTAVNAAYDRVADDLRHGTGELVAVTSITEVEA